MNAPRAERHDTGGRSRRRAATANGDHIQPITAPSSSSPGPSWGAIQDSIVIRYAAPNHQPRASASRVVGARTNKIMAGTSANHARYDRLSPGKIRMTGTAPARNDSHRKGWRSCRPSLLRNLTTPLSGTTGVPRHVTAAAHSAEWPVQLVIGSWTGHSSGLGGG